MSLTDEIIKDLGKEWIPTIYRERIRTQRTRAFEISVPSKENRVDIVHTLLGIQLKTRGKLIACPDLSTARYLRVFARIGCSDVAVPYDITRISSLADELESAWQRSLLILGEKSVDDSPQTRGRYRGAMIRTIRNQIEQFGAGDLMPAFDTETRQRKRE